MLKKNNNFNNYDFLLYKFISRMGWIPRWTTKYSVDSDINEEIEDLLCYQNKIIVDDDYAYMCKNGEISWYESHSNDEDDPWQLDELDGVSLFDTDNPRLIRINGSLF